MQKREYAFDILRVISMALVVVIHVSNVYSRSFGIISNKQFLGSLFFNTTARVSVPIFFMISGALLLDRKFDRKKYIKRIIKFLILIVVWDIIYLLWEYYFLGITYDKLYMLLIQPYRAHLWFLYTILLLYLVQPILKKVLYKTDKKIKIVLLIIWITLSTISIVNNTIAQVFTIFSHMGYFIIGKYLYDYAKKKYSREYNPLLVSSTIAAITISVTLNYIYSIKYRMFYNLFFAYRTPFIMVASMAIYTLVIANYKKEHLSKFITILSSMSLGVYLIHGIFLDITIKYFAYQEINSLLGITGFSLIILICSLMSVYLIKKTKVLSFLVE